MTDNTPASCQAGGIVISLKEAGQVLPVTAGNAAGVGGTVVPAAGSATHTAAGYGYRFSISAFERFRHDHSGVLGHFKTSDRDRIADLYGNILRVVSKVDRNGRPLASLTSIMSIPAAFELSEPLLLGPCDAADDRPAHPADTASTMAIRSTRKVLFIAFRLLFYGRPTLRATTSVDTVTCITYSSGISYASACTFWNLRYRGEIPGRQRRTTISRPSPGRENDATSAKVLSVTLLRP